MTRIRKIFPALLVVLLSPMAANAVPVVIDFEGAAPGGFLTGDLVEDGFTFTVNAGHYDIFTSGGNHYFNIDAVSSGNTTITLSMNGGGLFNVVSFDVINAADFANQFSIIAIGGSGNISAPLNMGVFHFGSGFHGISALQFVQNSSGYFAFDDLTLSKTNVPEPGSLALLGFGLIGAAARLRKA